MSFDIYMKWKVGYSVFVIHIQFVLDGLEFQVKYSPNFTHTESKLSQPLKFSVVT